MAAVNFNQLLTRFQIEIRDTALTTFNLAEQTEHLTAAIADRFVTIYDRDSLTTVAAQAVYPYTGAITDPTELFLDLSSNGYGTPIDTSAWDFINGNFIFKPTYKPMQGGLSLYIWGRRKLATTDLIPDTLQEYVLEVANLRALKMLKMTLGTRFLKNDITGAQISQMIAESKQSVADMRRDFTNNRPQRW
jgi:hypothetical protein